MKQNINIANLVTLAAEEIQEGIVWPLWDSSSYFTSADPLTTAHDSAA
jgi:hypothetical protein